MGSTTAPKWRPGSKGNKLDDHTAAALIEAVAAGAMLKDAAASAGVTRGTVWRWLQHADEPPPERKPTVSDQQWAVQLEHYERCQDLRDALEKAESDARTAALSRILSAGKNGTWQADAWFLERRYPHDYSRRVVEHQGHGGGPVQHQVEAGPTLADLFSDPGRVLIGQEVSLGDGTDPERLQAIADTLRAAFAAGQRQ